MAVPRSDTDSMCSIPFTVVVKARSLTVTIRPCISVGDSPEKFQMTVTTGMLMAGKMSTVMVRTDMTPRTAISRARTTNVYGRRRASRTIHMACGRLHASCRATPVVGMEAARAVAGLLTAAEQWVQCGASFEERRLDHGARSSDGAPAASQSQNCTEAAVSLHSVRTSWAMARNAPVEAVWLER